MSKPQTNVAVLTVALLAAGCTDILVGGMDVDSSDGPSDNDTHKDSNSDTESNADTTTETAYGADSEGEHPADTGICVLEDDYDTRGEVCYVDSVSGNDENTGLSPDAPYKTQAPVGSHCDVVRFKRGSRFDEKLSLHSNIKVYTNYGSTEDPLPKFVVRRESMSGPVVQAVMYEGITIDGLYIAGAKGDGTRENIIGGICVFLGANSNVLNSEITDCDIGVMVAGDGTLFQGNYIHDMHIDVTGTPGVDPTVAGGAVGVYINASNSEVAYNTFSSCKELTEGSCDGGATEVTAPACDTVSNIKIHHNFSINNCGLLQIGTIAGECNGTVKDVAIYQNVTIDSVWMGFLQVNNTELEGIHYYNNTSIHHRDSTNAGTLWIIYKEAAGDALLPGRITLTNNLFVFDEVPLYGNPIDDAFEQATNLVIYTNTEDPGLFNPSGTGPMDADLVAGSPAIDAGTLISGNTLDFLNRTIPYPGGGNPDIGAFEHGSTQKICLPARSPR